MNYVSIRPLTPQHKIQVILKGKNLRRKLSISPAPMSVNGSPAEIQRKIYEIKRYNIYNVF